MTTSLTTVSSLGHPGLPRQRVKKSYVSEMEKLVGELPAWMTKPEAPQSDPYESVRSVLNEPLDMDYKKTSICLQVAFRSLSSRSLFKLFNFSLGGDRVWHTASNST